MYNSFSIQFTVNYSDPNRLGFADSDSDSQIRTLWIFDPDNPDNPDILI